MIAQPFRSVIDRPGIGPRLSLREVGPVERLPQEPFYRTLRQLVPRKSKLSGKSYGSNTR